MTRYTLDQTTRRPPGGNVVIGGSPLRLFRLTDAGGVVFERLAAGEDVPDSRLTERLLDSGAVHPHHERGPFTAADITVVMPALDATAEVLNRLVRQREAPAPTRRCSSPSAWGRHRGEWRCRGL